MPTWTKVDPWFLYQIFDLVEIENELEKESSNTIGTDLLLKAKSNGFSDEQIAYLVADDVSEDDMRSIRIERGLVPGFRLVDTCAGEFPAQTPYFYSTYDSEQESVRSDQKKVIILGSGPNRIGQGIEFDYSCVHGVEAAHALGYEAIMINCNPETVSTDF